LGDVAEVLAADRQEADRLASLELFPPPAASRTRFLQVTELQDLLAARGIDRLDHRFSGAARVAVVGGRPTPAGGERPLPAPFIRRAERQVCEAIRKLLQEQSGGEQEWTVEVTLDESRARSVLDPHAVVSITRLASASHNAADLTSLTGPQHFELSVVGEQGAIRLPLEAHVSLPPAVVVAARVLPRGSLIRPGDVKLKHQAPGARPADEFHSLEEVLGMETTQPVAEGKPLQRGRSVRRPLLVKRGAPVTVVARTAGIRVRSTGRARESGSLGETIQVESLQNRETFFARVSNWREVEVYVRPAVVQPVGGPPPDPRQSPRYSSTKGIERVSFTR
jgi:flagella basal body P-ring formation protein FlgA